MSFHSDEKFNVESSGKSTVSPKALRMHAFLSSGSFFCFSFSVPPNRRLCFSPEHSWKLWRTRTVNRSLSPAPLVNLPWTVAPDCRRVASRMRSSNRNRVEKTTTTHPSIAKDYFYGLFQTEELSVIFGLSSCPPASYRRCASG